MIVECSNCQTRFQLESSRVPLSGIRVRCSRCKEAFFLEHPDASKEAAVHDAASRAAEAERVPAEPTEDLDRGAEPRGPEPEEEEDWEFNEEPVADGAGDDLDTGSDDDPDLDVDLDTDSFDLDDDGEDDPGESVVPGLGIDEHGDDDAPIDDGSGLDLAGEPEAASPDVDFDAGDDASDFGVVSDFSAGAPEEEIDPAEQDGEPSPLAESVAAAKAAAPEAAIPDVGEPEDWDFFSDESLEEPGALEPQDHAMGRAMADIEADVSAQAARQPGPDLAHKRSAGGAGKALAGIARLIGWSITLGLFGLGLAYGLSPVDVRDAGTPTVFALGVLQADEVRASWIDTLRPTRTYSVRGRLVNVDRHPRMAGPGAQVTLLASDGTRLDLPPALAGVPIAEELLREQPSAHVAAYAARSRAALAETRLEPGEAVEFQSFFETVPDEAVSFILEMPEKPPIAPRIVAPPVMDVAPLGMDEAAIGEAGVDGVGGEEPTTPTSASPSPGTPAPSLP